MGQCQEEQVNQERDQCREIIDEWTKLNNKENFKISELTEGDVKFLIRISL